MFRRSCIFLFVLCIPLLLAEVCIRIAGAWRNQKVYIYSGLNRAVFVSNIKISESKVLQAQQYQDRCLENFMGFSLWLSPHGHEMAAAPPSTIATGWKSVERVYRLWIMKPKIAQKPFPADLSLYVTGQNCTTQQPPVGRWLERRVVDGDRGS